MPNCFFLPDTTYFREISDFSGFSDAKKVWTLFLSTTKQQKQQKFPENFVKIRKSVEISLDFLNAKK